MAFGFIDLFAGIGGFHAALDALGGEALLASEIDPAASATYERFWGLRPHGDIRELAASAHRDVPDHQVLAGGFPCQPFSKSGHQRGMSEIRGQLFGEILKILEAKTPTVVALENVRNIVGPRQRHVWDAIVFGLRETGYRVPSEPCILSPHLIPPSSGGSPQSRDRVFILATYVGRERALRETDLEPVLPRRIDPKWDPREWDLARDVLDDRLDELEAGFAELSSDETKWFVVWNDFLARTSGIHLPGFPLWSHYWSSAVSVDRAAPAWKQDFERKNIDFYRANRRVIDGWLREHPVLRTFPLSRQKLEWQAGDEARDLYRCLIQLRPSGIRVKPMAYAPALVAMTQTPYLGPMRRRLTVREAQRLQALPDWMDFGAQPDAASFKQLGNAVHVGAAYLAIRAHVLRDAEEISDAAPNLLAAVSRSPRAYDPTSQSGQHARRSSR